MYIVLVYIIITGSKTDSYLNLNHITESDTVTAGTNSR